MGVIQDIEGALAFVENAATLRDLVQLGARVATKVADAIGRLPQGVIDAELRAIDAAADAAEKAKLGG
jgi:hypothetical protein